MGNYEKTVYKLWNKIKIQRAICLIKQKILATIMMIIGLVIPLFADCDITVSLLLIPIGILIFFTKKIVIYDEDTEKLKALIKKYKAITKE